VHLSEWLKQSGNMTSDHLKYIDNFARVNDDLVTSGVPTQSDIADITLNKQDSHANNTYVLKTQVPSMPTYPQDQEGMKMFDNSDIGSGVFNALSVIKGNLRDFKVKYMKETTI
jgi:hypothetical protein